MHFSHTTKRYANFFLHHGKGLARDSKKQASKRDKSHQSHSGEQAQMRSMTQVCSFVSLS